jgi:hypothetical protein
MRHGASLALVLALSMSTVLVDRYGQNAAVDRSAKGLSCYVEGGIPRCIQPVPLIPPSSSGNSSEPGQETLGGADRGRNSASLSRR